MNSMTMSLWLMEFEPDVGQHAEVGVVEYTLKTMAG